jgi:hypothetical protein
MDVRASKRQWYVPSLSRLHFLLVSNPSIRAETISIELLVTFESSLSKDSARPRA